MTIGDDTDVARLAERFAALLADGGLPRMPARVFAQLLLDDADRLTAGELSERLGVSPAAISGAVRYLLQVGMIERGREAGARRDHFRLPDDAWAEMYESRTGILRRWEDVAGEAADRLGDAPGGRRAAEARDFFAFVRAELPELMRRWRERPR